MVGQRDNTVIYYIAQHFSQFASKDKGVVDMGDSEPGTPDLIPFSFCFTSNESMDFDIARRFVNPVIVLDKTSGGKK